MTMSKKRRLNLLVDANLATAAKLAAKRCEAPTLSAWMNDAIRMKLEHDRTLRSLAEYIADHERELGPITDRDCAEAERETRRRAIRVRPRG